ncbi:MAG: 50S ribosomal protein L22 [Candidatus Margulisiibacteriota bacterium]
MSNTKYHPQAVAHSKYIRVSPFKLRRLADVVRGKQVDHAVAILKSMPQPTALPLRKTLESAIANATNNAGLTRADLFVTYLLINEAPKLKRFQPRARGRIYKIIKRSSHITAGVDLLHGGNNGAKS